MYLIKNKNKIKKIYNTTYLYLNMIKFIKILEIFNQLKITCDGFGMNMFIVQYMNSFILFMRPHIDLYCPHQLTALKILYIMLQTIMYVYMLHTKCHNIHTTHTHLAIHLDQLLFAHLLLINICPLRQLEKKSMKNNSFHYAYKMRIEHLHI